MQSAVVTSTNMLEKIGKEIEAANEYAKEKMDGLVTRPISKLFSPEQPVLRQGTNGKFKIGYIVTTCSPATHAHIELAKYAIEKLDLTHVFYLVWPFQYIPGFHAKDVSEWASEETHLNHSQREKILALSIADAGIPASVFADTADLYKLSAKNYKPDDKHSYFWTGTWYVIRCLQAQLMSTLNTGKDSFEFHFICGEDQFNPNIQAFVQEHLTDGDLVEKVWKDYSITQELALHNVFGVPRNTKDTTIEHFEFNHCKYENKVTIGDPLKCQDISATQIRRGQAVPLEDYCTSSAAKYIRDHGFWGYDKLPKPEPHTHHVRENYEPLHKFLPLAGNPNNMVQFGGNDFGVFAKKVGHDFDDPYCILYQVQSKPYFRKYYVSQ